MRNRFFFFLIFLVSIFSCSENNEKIVPKTLQDHININSNLLIDEVIACAASKNFENNISYIFYYPELGASEIKYFETSSIEDDKNNFSLYKEKEILKENVFNGYLGRFLRNSSTEVWCIVTYKTNGKFHKSNPIRLKNISKPTEWTDVVTIDNSTSLMPKFLWDDGLVKENAIYFQVITDSENNLLSGTYTYDKWFQYYNLANVVLNVTRSTPPNLIQGEDYGFTMMGVSEDNWVNLVIQKKNKAE